MKKVEKRFENSTTVSGIVAKAEVVRLTVVVVMMLSSCVILQPVQAAGSSGSSGVQRPWNPPSVSTTLSVRDAETDCISLNWLITTSRATAATSADATATSATSAGRTTKATTTEQPTTTPQTSQTLQYFIKYSETGKDTKHTRNFQTSARRGTHKVCGLKSNSQYLFCLVVLNHTSDSEQCVRTETLVADTSVYISSSIGAVVCVLLIMVFLTIIKLKWSMIVPKKFRKTKLDADIRGGPCGDEDDEEGKLHDEGQDEVEGEFPCACCEAIEEEDEDEEDEEEQEETSFSVDCELCKANAELEKEGAAAAPPPHQHLQPQQSTRRQQQQGQLNCNNHNCHPQQHRQDCTQHASRRAELEKLEFKKKSLRSCTSAPAFNSIELL